MNQLAPEINNLLEGIEKRTDIAIQKIQEEKKELAQDFHEFNEKTNKIIKFMKFRGKVDKIEVGYNLIIDSKESKKIKELTNKTATELFDKALKKAGGDEEKAISLLFDPSSDI